MCYERGDADDTIRDDGGLADRILFGTGISPDDVTIDTAGNTIILDIRDNGDLVGDRVIIVDGFSRRIRDRKPSSSRTRLSGISQRSPRARRTTMRSTTASTSLAAPTSRPTRSTRRSKTGFTITVADTGGVDTIDLKIGTSGTNTLTPVLNGSTRSGDDLVLDVTIDSTVPTIPTATGTLTITDYYTPTGFIETIQFGATVLNGANAAPEVALPLADHLVLLDTPVGFGVPVGTFTDSAFDRLTYSATLADGSALPGWLSIDGESGNV